MEKIEEFREIKARNKKRASRKKSRKTSYEQLLIPANATFSRQINSPVIKAA